MGSKTYNDANGSRIDSLQAANIDSLGVVSEPVTKVGTPNHHSRPLFAVDEGQSLKNIFNIAMSPVVALDLGDRGNVAGTESCGLVWENNQNKS